MNECTKGHPLCLFLSLLQAAKHDHWLSKHCKCVLRCIISSHFLLPAKTLRFLYSTAKLLLKHCPLSPPQLFAHALGRCRAPLPHLSGGGVKINDFTKLSQLYRWLLRRLRASAAVHQLYQNNFQLYDEPMVPGCSLWLPCPWNHVFLFCIDHIFLLFPLQNIIMGLYWFCFILLTWNKTLSWQRKHGRRHDHWVRITVQLKSTQSGTSSIQPVLTG